MRFDWAKRVFNISNGVQAAAVAALTLLFLALLGEPSEFGSQMRAAIAGAASTLIILGSRWIWGIWRKVTDSSSLVASWGKRPLLVVLSVWWGFILLATMVSMDLVRGEQNANTTEAVEVTAREATPRLGSDATHAILVRFGTLNFEIKTYQVEVNVGAHYSYVDYFWCDEEGNRVEFPLDTMYTGSGNYIEIEPSPWVSEAPPSYSFEIGYPSITIDRSLCLYFEADRPMSLEASAFN
ncbi:MAG: hypothetical protein O2812_00325 [Chloroflexi bacterium]|nr:hypothetical protein [Chloroflexota bacterium]